MASLHVFGGQTLALDAQWGADARYLNSLDVAALSAVAGAVTSFLASVQETDVALMDKIDGLIAAHGLKAKPLRSAVRTLLLLLRGASKHAVSGAGLKEDLTALGMDDAHGTIIGDAWEAVRHIVAATFAGVAAPVAAAPLIDAAWRLGVTVSSDDIARVGSTYVQLMLTTAASSSTTAAASSGSSTHHVELTIAQFYDLLAQLERAKQYVDCLAGAPPAGTATATAGGAAAAGSS